MAAKVNLKTEIDKSIGFGLIPQSVSFQSHTYEDHYTDAKSYERLPSEEGGPRRAW